MIEPAAPTDTLRVQDVVGRLVELGFSEVEAKIYVHLAAGGGAKAGDVAKLLDLSRGETYRTLQTLVDRRAIVATLTRPTEFHAVPIDQIFEDLLTSERERVQRLELARADVGHALERLRASAEPPRTERLRVLRGRQSIQEATEQMVLEAVREVKLLTTHPRAAALAQSGDFASICEERARSGVTFQLLSSDPRHPMARLATAVHRDIPAGAQVAQVLIVDDREVCLWLVNDTSTRLRSDKEAAFWSDAGDLVHVQSQLFDTAWAAAGSAKGAEAKPVEITPVDAAPEPMT